MFEAIAKFFKAIFEGIGNFFNNLFGGGEAAPTASARPITTERTPPAGEDVLVSKTTSRTFVPVTVDRQTSAAIGKVVKDANTPGYLGHEYAPDSLTGHFEVSKLNPTRPDIGTASAPILQQGSDDRLLVNVPEGASVFITSETKMPSRMGVMPTDTVVLSVVPSMSDLGKFTRKALEMQDPSIEQLDQESGTFTGRSYVIPKSLVENGQIVFNTPSQGKNTFGVSKDMDEPGTLLIVESHGAKVAPRGVDAIVNGRVVQGAARTKKEALTEENIAQVLFDKEAEKNAALWAAIGRAKERRHPEAPHGSANLSTRKANGEEFERPESASPRSNKAIQKESAHPFDAWRGRRGGRAVQQFRVSKVEHVDHSEPLSPDSTPNLLDPNDKNYTV